MKTLHLDGLVGPTHHYGGLAYGNQASIQHRHQCADPRAAALQGLEKMKYLYTLGIPQGFIPPPKRPHLALLRQLGFAGSPVTLIQHAFKEAPHLLSIAYAASSMWVANAATISCATDTLDGKTHFTPANLLTQLHRTQEVSFTRKVLQLIFHDQRYFTHHLPLCASSLLADEGAANHMRLASSPHDPGFNLFVYGYRHDHPAQHPQRFPARQTLEASQCIARSHGLNANKTFFIQQTPQAIDAGVFHNDVIAMSNESHLIIHEQAFLNQKSLLKTLKKTLPFPLTVIEIPTRQLSLKKAVATYLFNSQLVTLPQNQMILIAPEECRADPVTNTLIQSWCQDPQHFIQTVHYINLKQSMHNGGGPACLRLKILLPDAAFQTIHLGILFNEIRFQQLTQWVNKHYRDRLSFYDLQDPQLIDEVEQALLALEALIKLPHLYPTFRT